MTRDPGTTDDLPFALPGSGSSEPSAQSAPAPSFDDDQDGILNPHEDLGQAGTEPDQGPAIGPAADAGEPAE